MTTLKKGRHACKAPVPNIHSINRQQIHNITIKRPCGHRTWAANSTGHHTNTQIHSISIHQIQSIITKRECSTQTSTQHDYQKYTASTANTYTALLRKEDIDKKHEMPQVHSINTKHAQHQLLTGIQHRYQKRMPNKQTSASISIQHPYQKYAAAATDEYTASAPAEDA